MEEKERKVEDYLDSIFGGKPKKKTMYEISLERLHPPKITMAPITESDERGAELPESIMSSTLNDAPLDALSFVSETSGQSVGRSSLVPFVNSIPTASKVKKNSQQNGGINQLEPDSTLAIDYDAIAKSSEFRRFIFYLMTGKTHRGSLEKLDKDIKKIQDTNKLAYQGVMNEFKEKVKQIRGEQNE